MTTIVTAGREPSLEARLGARIAAERVARGWSAAELAARAGVSRAMIGKIERGAASPTASLLGRLSGALGLTLSALLARVEHAGSRVVRRAEQAVWRDPASGYVRRALSPPDDPWLELIDVDLPAGARVPFPAAAYAFIHQQIWVRSGVLTFREGDTVHTLRAGDCLALGPPADCVFENRTRRACRYIVAIARTSAR